MLIHVRKEVSQKQALGGGGYKFAFAHEGMTLHCITSSVVCTLADISWGKKSFVILEQFDFWGEMRIGFFSVV